MYSEYLWDLGFQQQKRGGGRVCEKGCYPNTSSVTRQPRRQRHQLQPSDQAVSNSSLHGLMEGWKGRGRRGRGGGGSHNLDNHSGYIFTSKGSRGPIKRTPGSFHDNYPFPPLANGPETRESLIRRKRGKRRGRERGGFGWWYG